MLLATKTNPAFGIISKAEKGDSQLRYCTTDHENAQDFANEQALARPLSADIYVGSRDEICPFALSKARSFTFSASPVSWRPPKSLPASSSLTLRRRIY
jgi:hypothetical protein